jgi:hypothetical protein
MPRIAAFFVLLAAGAIGLAACNNNGSSSVSACGLPAGMQAALVYPAPNATRISTTVSQVVVGTSGTLPSDWQSGSGWDVELVYTPSGTYPGGAFGMEFASASPPFPAPNATPSFANPSYWSSSFSYASNSNTPLPPGTSITVWLNDLNSSCFPGVTIGSFST